MRWITGLKGKDISLTDGRMKDGENRSRMEEMSRIFLPPAARVLARCNVAFRRVS